MKNYIGIDIGGTKCAVTLANVENNKINITNKKVIKTKEHLDPFEMLNFFTETINSMIKMNNQKISDYSSIGISCGGPLDSKNGIILSPPNLPGWDVIRITEYFKNMFGLDTYLQNDANACALAEWRFGSGVGYNNVIFLTFGTGMGAGLILDGHLYEGTNGNAGEIGHVRLTNNGPIGYGKKGSFEGYCSGGGLKQIAEMELLKAKKHNIQTKLADFKELSAEIVFKCAINGDKVAKKIVRDCAKNLSKGISILIDILNPEAIIIGSIYSRNEDLLKPLLLKYLNIESLPSSYLVTNIYPSKLGDSIGDYAAISVAFEGEKS